jgi:hypothetical protein
LLTNPQLPRLIPQNPTASPGTRRERREEILRNSEEDRVFALRFSGTEVSEAELGVFRINACIKHLGDVWKMGRNPTVQ